MVDLSWNSEDTPAYQLSVHRFTWWTGSVHLCFTTWFILYSAWVKKMGAKICYSRTKKTFYYTNRFNLNMQIKVSLLGEKETDILGSGSVKVLSESKVTCDFVALNLEFWEYPYWKHTYLADHNLLFWVFGTSLVWTTDDLMTDLNWN